MNKKPFRSSGTFSDATTYRYVVDLPAKRQRRKVKAQCGEDRGREMKWVKIKRRQKPRGTFFALVATRCELGHAVMAFAYWNGEGWREESLNIHLDEISGNQRWVYAYAKVPDMPKFNGIK